MLKFCPACTVEHSVCPLILFNMEIDNRVNDELVLNLQNEKKFFAGILSHDLRSPLSSIVLLASYVKTKPDLADTLPFIEMIEQSARKELDLMGTLLLLMRAGSPTKKEDLIEIDLKAEAEIIVSNLQSDLDQKKISVNLHIPDQTKIAGEIQIFNIVLKNLLKNAIFYSLPEQEISIASTENEANTIIKFQFITEELFNQETEYFFSSNRLITNGSKEFSSHIDLYFCRKLISTYNGTIHAQVNKSNSSCSLILTLKRNI